MTKPITRPQRSRRYLTVELTFEGQRYGRLEVDKRALQQAIVGSFSHLRAQLALAGVTKDPEPWLRRSRSCARHVVERVEEVTRDLAGQEFINWLRSQGSDDDLLKELETGWLTLDIASGRDLVDRIANTERRPNDDE